MSAVSPTSRPQYCSLEARLSLTPPAPPRPHGFGTLGSRELTCRQQLDEFADRTSSHKMWANQLRLYWSSMAYLLWQALRRPGLKGTELAQARCQTILAKVRSHTVAAP